MPKLITTKAGKLDWKDAFGIAITKSILEQVLTPFIGNATVMSGGVKLLGAGIVKSMLGGKIGDIGATALTVDGTEDVVKALFGGQLGSVAGMFGGGNSSGGTI